MGEWPRQGCGGKERLWSRNLHAWGAEPNVRQMAEPEYGRSSGASPPARCPSVGLPVHVAAECKATHQQFLTKPFAYTFIYRHSLCRCPPLRTRIYPLHFLFLLLFARTFTSRPFFVSSVSFFGGLLLYFWELECFPPASFLSCSTRRPSRQQAHLHEAK